VNDIDVCKSVQGMFVLFIVNNNWFIPSVSFRQFSGRGAEPCGECPSPPLRENLKNSKEISNIRKI